MDKSKFSKRYEGKVAIVTASTQGIGFSIAERLGLEGASVVVSSRKQNNVDEAVEKLKAQGIEVLGVVCHVSNEQQRKNLIDKTVQKYGKIDVVVSNAAANPSIDDILQTQESVLDKLWEINVKSSILILKDAAPHLQKGSSVVIISSFTAYQPPATMAMYGVTKTALLGLTKALAAEMAPNTRVNCVAPGFVPTSFAAFLTTNDAIRKEIEQRTLLNRLGTTKDMAAATAFLASDDASYITGEILVVAGGMPSRL
ncbi:tropinone reductase-like 3 [Quercus suber]|uniref:Tropinone reductase-like 3 n=1 Tax=Quercus suber TaxID=58331 RepID=A0AAW0KNQ4_QUESU|nr:tropinone reductase-like 3 [Quercus suber]XP_023895590.1 tropinone reductase-like 3 [Quercus suber]POE57214.1 tropinone reductase-like 3 [Quercus suber]